MNARRNARVATVFAVFAGLMTMVVYAGVYGILAAVDTTTAPWWGLVTTMAGGVGVAVFAMGSFGYLMREALDSWRRVRGSA